MSPAPLGGARAAVWAPRTPFLFFSDHRDPAIARATSRGRLAEFEAFGWRADQIPDPQAASSFLRSKLDWSEPEREPHSSLLNWYRELIHLRRRLNRDGVELERRGRVLTMRRDPLTLACDFGRGRVRLDSAMERPPS